MATKPQGDEGDPVEDNYSLPDVISEHLAEAYYRMLAEGGPTTLEDFERGAVEMLHRLGARAYGAALERRDEELRASLPEGARAHDRRARTLATRLGDVTFRATRCLDRLGLPFCPLLDELDVPRSARVSPAAASTLVSLATNCSYARAASTLADMGGSAVSATCVMSLVRAAGARCAEQDAALSAALFGDGVLPGGGRECESLCVEADGTWFSVQGPDRERAARCEVKAVVAYAGKEASRSGRVSRDGVARHACVAPAGAFMPEAVAAVGTAYDLSSVREVHVGCDGEPWCAQVGEWFPGARATAHLDPFHVNRAILSCFPDPKLGWSVAEAVWDGGKQAAACLVEAAAAQGLARPEPAARVAAYLRNNADKIDVGGPSLGTMESENQHVYGARMDSFPCAWSVRGASDMARLRSRAFSGRAVPRATREASGTARWRRARAERELAALARLSPSNVVKSEGRGREPPRASVAALGSDARFAACIDGGMAGVGI